MNKNKNLKNVTKRQGMAGGFCVLKDIPKTLVWQLARWRNQQSLVIPGRVLTHTPSAELAPDQRDQNNLPPYEVLDQILQYYIEENKSAETIIKASEICPGES